MTLLGNVYKFLKSLLPGRKAAGRKTINPTEWRPLKEGEPGYGSRQYVRKSVKHATVKTERLPVRQYQQAVKGMRLEERAARNLPSRLGGEVDELRRKRRETAAQKKKYKGEKIATIRKYDKARPEFEQRRRHNISVRDTGEGEFKPQEDFEFLQSFAQKHKDLDPEFAALFDYPAKKRRQGGPGRLDPKGRPIRDMRRAEGNREPSSYRKAA
jgi:hypothetical protein